MKDPLLPALTIVLALAFSSASEATSPKYEQGVQLYRAQNYAGALSQFSQAERTNPSDPAVHYYIGLCYRLTNQMRSARREFEWVAYYGHGSWRSEATTALQLLPQRQASSAPSTGTPTNLLASKPSGLHLQGQLKVLEFVTGWCGVCHAFEPIWSKVSTQMSRVASFSQLDAEDPANHDIVKKYAIRAYPTFVYTDNSGKVLRRMEGAPGNESSFAAQINQLAGN